MAARYVVVLLSAISSGARATDFWVSATKGSDSADGTVSHPFATLQRAQQAVRSALDMPAEPTVEDTKTINAMTDTLTDNITVHVGPGLYFAPSGLRFSQKDSGRQGMRVRWLGPGPHAGITDPATAAIVHGGVAVPPASWRPAKWNPSVWATNASALRPSGVSAGQPPPPAVKNKTYPHCGQLLVGVSFEGNDLVSLQTGQWLAASNAPHTHTHTLSLSLSLSHTHSLSPIHIHIHIQTRIHRHIHR